MTIDRRVFIGFGIAAALLLAFPPVASLLGIGAFWITLLFRIFTFTTLAVSWNFFCGYSGYSSFGHGAFFGIGMYTTSTLLMRLNFPYFLTIPFAGLMAGFIALLMGGIVFRIPRFRGEMFSLMTLVLTFVVLTFVANVPLIDGGSGVSLAEVDLPKFITRTNLGTYYLSLVIVLLTVGVAYGIYVSRWGRALFAIRDDEDAAEAVGIPTYAYKLATFALSAFFAGLLGSVEAVNLGYFEPVNVFNILTPLLALMMAILGGATVWYGPIIGAAIITSLILTPLIDNLLSTLLGTSLSTSQLAGLKQIIIGLILVGVILFVPEGIAGRFERWRQGRLSAAAQQEAAG